MNIDKWISDNLFSIIPIPAAIIDRSYNLVRANCAFEKMLGSWQDKKCFNVYKNSDSLCLDCKASDVFADGKSKVNADKGYDAEGKLINYIEHIIPVHDNIGNVPYLIKTISDISEVEQLKQEYKYLFEHVPCNIKIIDKNFKIVKTNNRTREMFGDIEGDLCFKVLKGYQKECTDCVAQRTFQDGKMHSGRSTVINKSGNIVEFHVTTVPFDVIDGNFDSVLEMDVDITRPLELEDELKLANTFMKSLISASLDGIIGVNESGEITIFNAKAKKMFNINDKQKIAKDDLAYMLHQNVLDDVSSQPVPLFLNETQVNSIDGESFPVRLIGIKLMIDNQYMGKAFWIQDLRKIKKMEAEKLEAEHMAAVGQTVAGLAHGMKNVITGLEGGTYLLNSGLIKGDAIRALKGMEMVNRNSKRVSTFVSEFLNYTKGQMIKVNLCNPVEIAKEIINLYSVKVKDFGIDMQIENDDQIELVALDRDGIHECLANLVGNAIDACQISENSSNSRIIIRIFEDNGVIRYEVNDNGCGMDYDVQKNIFTNFFTTKGLGGTGLGLLMAKKIVNQHGGRIEFDSQMELGSTFRILLPRNNLPKIEKMGSATESAYDFKL